MAYDDEKDLNSILAKDKHGRLSSVATDYLMGLNQTGEGVIAPPANDNSGMTFFTKPNLNLSYDNNVAIDKWRFLNGDARTLGAAVRCALSPKVGLMRHSDWVTNFAVDDAQSVRSEITDDRQAFLTPFTNSIRSISGFPPLEVEVATGSEGFRKQAAIFADTVPADKGPISLSVALRNVEGSPVISMMDVWLEYIGFVGVGTINPYPYCIVEDEIDYMTAVYRFVMDPTMRFIRFAAWIPNLIPTMVDVGAVFNFSDRGAIPQEEVALQFEGRGWFRNDPIIFVQFNRVVVSFNPSMGDDRRDTEMVHIAHKNIELFKGRKSYPRVTTGFELQWWTTPEVWKDVQEEFQIEINNEE